MPNQSYNNLCLYVLNSIFDDIESVHTILKLLNKDGVDEFKDQWGQPFTQSEVHRALNTLISDELAVVFFPEGPDEYLAPRPNKDTSLVQSPDARFGITPKGRKLHMESPEE
jgi:hypothetical protein